MLKKMKVGRKISLSFGIVIALVVISVLVSGITSYQRASDLNRVNTLSDMQREANLMQDCFDDARFSSNTAFTALDAEAAYAECYANIGSALDHLAAVEEYTADIEGFDSAIAETRTGLGDFKAGLQSIQDNDGPVAVEIENIMEKSVLLAESSSQLFNTMARASAQSDNYAAMVNSVLIPTQQLSEEIDAMRLTADSVFIGLDTSTSPEIYAALESISANANALLPRMNSEDTRAAINTMLGALESYRASLDSVLAIMHDTESKIAATQTQMDELSNFMAGSVLTISGLVDNLIDQTLWNSNLSMYIVLGVTLVAVIIAVIMTRILRIAITKPLNLMKDALVQTGETGNLNFSEDTKRALQAETAAKDELGDSIRAFVNMMEHQIYIGGILTKVAEGDLTNEVSLLSAQDTMGTALKDMSDNLNNMFQEINNVANQVASSAGEIAHGSQALAEGASEQAATVEEISASIVEITSQSDTSVKTAKQASEEGAHIRDIAAEGNEKMKSMMAAVQEINDASQAISKVIKAIDDIAFQTNILALNAAVEAARAGVHGKGFAVVADEVRNLAGKSADAAKETTVLISANIQKAELGLSISNDTARSLEQIVVGIQHTSESLLDMTRQSEAVSVATSQVNIAVEQVAQVVQQNSATSEESAAASEEMSSQAQVLKGLISRFRIRGASHEGFQAAPSLYELSPMTEDKYDTSFAMNG